MPIAVDVSNAPGYLIFRFKDEWPDAKEQSEMHRRLHADNHLTATTRALIDVREATIPRYQQAEQTATIGIRNDAWPHKCAFLVGSVVQYGFSRQLQSLAPPGSIIEIFSDEEKALQWLCGEQEPGPGHP